MTVSAGTLKRLAALQLAPEAMQEVLSIIASCIEPLENRRRRDRDRKGKIRGTCNGISAENPQTVRGNSQEIPSDNPPPDIIPPLKQDSSKPKRAFRYMEIPDRPTDEADAFARNEGWREPRIASEWQRFRDHGLAKDRKFSSERGLHAGWRNWVRSPYQVNGASNGPRGSEFSTAIDGLISESKSRECPDDFGDPDYGDICAQGR